jgi:rhamnulose-1-phosphate aldolase/alcohol dehydrogenase
MQNRWSEAQAQAYLDRYGPQFGADLASRIYSARLVGAESSLVLHGGGNTSVKTQCTNLLGEHVAAICVKASGYSLAEIGPDGHSSLQLAPLLKLRAMSSMTDSTMAKALRTCLIDPCLPSPSIETLAHALLPEAFIDHTHADAILALTNQAEGRRCVEEALGDDVVVVDYVEPGFDLALAAAAAYESRPECRGMVWMRHGLVTWGATARQSYEATVELVTKAENYLAAHAARALVISVRTPAALAEARWAHVAPVLRGALAVPSGDADWPYQRVILQPLLTREALDFVDAAGAREIALTPPLTSDHLIRTKALPCWVESPDYDDLEKFRVQVERSVASFASEYDAYVDRHLNRMPEGIARFDANPRVLLLPGMGAVCAGKNIAEARIVRDVTEHTLRVKAQVAAMGVYEALAEHELFDMEYRTLQHAKLAHSPRSPLASSVALVTGAAGAIGSAIAEALLEQGCHVIVTDLPGARLEEFTRELERVGQDRVAGVPMDVTEPESVARGFEAAIRQWGGVDLVIVNAGAAWVSPLADMQLEAFRRLEKVNVEGSLLVLAEAARLFRLQRTGGDIVLISTKNVFSPGARFGAYSATKAAAHQLARIASLELAEIDVRVNMVAPDAVFSHAGRKSGLWAEVGPDRMRARGLNEAELEEYYRQRNLLKARVTARHVARAVLFFASRQTPTTGATIPVDGGLPDATPR